MLNKEYTPNQVAALIIFNDNVEKQRVEKWIKKLKEQGHVQNADVKAFDSRMESPCLYFP